MWNNNKLQHQKYSIIKNNLIWFFFSGEFTKHTQESIFSMLQILSVWKVQAIPSYLGVSLDLLKRQILRSEVKSNWNILYLNSCLLVRHSVSCLIWEKLVFSSLPSEALPFSPYYCCFICYTNDCSFLQAVTGTSLKMHSLYLLFCCYAFYYGIGIARKLMI